MTNDGSVATSWRRDLPCFRCERTAVTLVVDYASGGRGVTLVRDGFLARKSSFLSVPAAEGIAEEDGVELLRWLPQAFHGFFCRECAATYCATCWRVGPPEHDEEGYAGRLGVCPAGHESVVDGGG
jgi:hypothetical protein